MVAGGGSSAVSVSEPVAVVAEEDHFGVVEEPVDHGQLALVTLQPTGECTDPLRWASQLERHPPAMGMRPSVGRPVVSETEERERPALRRKR